MDLEMARAVGTSALDPEMLVDDGSQIMSEASHPEQFLSMPSAPRIQQRYNAGACYVSAMTRIFWRVSHGMWDPKDAAATQAWRPSAAQLHARRGFHTLPKTKDSTTQRTRLHLAVSTSWGSFVWVSLW